VVDPAKSPPPGLPHFRDLEELLRNGPEIDAVALCTPPAGASRAGRGRTRCAQARAA